MASLAPSTLRQRRQPGPSLAQARKSAAVAETKKEKNEEIVWGKTPHGEVFRVPTTHDVLTALFHPAYPKSHLDLVNLFLLGSQIVLFFLLPRPAARIFFLLYFAFWRAAYDAGLGWVLTKQSKRKWIVKEVQRRGWLDAERRPEVRDWIRKQLAGKMGKDYSFDELPLEYNTWLLFRQLVDIILLNDFVAYCMFAFACFRVPVDLSLTVHILRWVGGLALIAFNLWVKTEAHAVVKDYGWYWGDVFFQRGALVFDGVFELAPHPMYSVGYAGYYGLSLIVGSYPVLFVSLAAHAAQFAFLVFFENPHIERAYGQRKLLAQRTPVARTIQRISGAVPPMHARASSTASTSTTSSADLSTPTNTDGDTATESDTIDTETETELDDRISRRSSSSGTPIRKTKLSHVVTQHDLLSLYFRHDVIIFKNLDLLRTPDLQLVLAVTYPIIYAVLPNVSASTTLTLHFVHALAWSLFHEFGLGLLLRAQSERKFLVRHFLQNYYYPPNDGGKGAVQDAFSNWKQLYNLSICMTYVSFFGLAWKTYTLPAAWTVGNELLRHTFGILLIGLQIWSSMESYEVLGVFGWFFGDFFIEDFPTNLDYTGIYRYLNNPEIMTAAAFFGVALITGSKMLFALAAIRLMSHWWFLSSVEYPHMRKLYGDSLRTEAGFVKVIKKVAIRNAALLESRAGRHAPKIKNVAKEVKGTFEKVYEETAEAVDEFLAKSKPRISEVVQDTKVLLQQSRERLVITRVSSNIPDTTNYKISVLPAADGSSRFHLGEPIRVSWQAPLSHSRRDWIGIYKVGANQSTLVTKVASHGLWLPVHDEEWDGDVPVRLEKPITLSTEETEQGEVVFRGNTLPWHIGQYELRYHHGGKYNVLSIDGPIEIYVDRPDPIDFSSVRSYLLHLVTLCLDSDPSLIPMSAKTPTSEEPREEEDSRGLDDFNFWSERQAQRISIAIQQAFDVEYAPEVIKADANVSALANRILVSKEILSP